MGRMGCEAYHLAWMGPIGQITSVSNFGGSEATSLLMRRSMKCCSSIRALSTIDVLSACLFVSNEASNGSEDVKSCGS